MRRFFQGAVPSTMIYDPYTNPVTQPAVTYKGVRTKDAKYVEYLDPEGNVEKEFYYLAADPHEVLNRANNPTAYPRHPVIAGTGA